MGGGIDGVVNPIEIANRFRFPGTSSSPSVDIVSIEDVMPGMSGGRVYRVISRQGTSLALKQYSSSQPRHRIEEIHGWIGNLSADPSALVAPRFPVCNSERTVLQQSGPCWELSPWIDGRPLNQDASPQQIAIGVDALCRFHASASSLGQRVGRSPSVGERFQLLDPSRQFPDANGVLQQAPFDGDKELTDALMRACWLLREYWKSQSERLRQELSEQCFDDRLQLVLRDIHREHLLFSFSADSQQESPPPPIDQPGGASRFSLGSAFDEPESCEAAGLIDFDSMRFDFPELDVARWIGSFCGENRCFDELLPQVEKLSKLADLTENRAFKDNQVSPLDRKRILLFYRTGLWIGLANWAVWLTDGRYFPAGSKAVAQRIHHLCDQVPLREH